MPARLSTVLLLSLAACLAQAQVSLAQLALDQVAARQLVAERAIAAGSLDAKRALALGGGSKGGDSAGPEQVAGVGFIGQVIDGLDTKNLRGLVDDAKARMGSGVAVLVAVNDGRASVSVGVTDDLTTRFSAVDLVRVAATALGGQGGGGRPDMAQAGGPDGAKAGDAVAAVRAALAG